MEIPWALVAAIASATIAFIYTRLQKHLEFQHRRRSLAIAISIEIAEASKGIEQLHIGWDQLDSLARDPARKPLLVISSDTQVLDRTHLEDLNFPPEVVASITRFHNSIREMYACLKPIASEDFMKGSPESRMKVVEMAAAVADETFQRADAAIGEIQTQLPVAWFK